MVWFKSSWVVEPAVPGPVRDDYALVAAEHVRAQEPLLYTGFCIGAPWAAWMGEGLNPALRFGLPVVILALCLIGLFLRRKPPVTAPQARRALALSTLVSSGVLALGSAWAILAWYAAPEAQRLGYPFFIALGVIVTGYTFAKVRRMAAAAMIIGLVPIASVLLAQGSPIERNCALAMLLAGVFLFVMARNNRRLLVELLENRHRLHALSRRDSLTGLPNRRAFLEDADRIGKRAGKLRLILLDIDRFKAINDRHGHDMGDQVLCAVARIIEGFAIKGVSAARVGGEEFALMGSTDDLSAISGLHLLTTLRSAEMPHGMKVTASIGMATGPLKNDGDWKSLYSMADQALYKAKAEGRDCAVSGPPEASDGVHEPLAGNAGAPQAA